MNHKTAADRADYLARVEAALKKLPVQAGTIIRGFGDLPDGIGATIGQTGEFSVDAKDGPILAQSWYVQDRICATREDAGSRDATRRAALRIEGWIAAGLIRRVDLMLLQVHIWAMTETYAVMGTEVRYMLGMGEGAALDANHIAAEVTQLVWNGVRP